MIRKPRYSRRSESSGFSYVQCLVAIAIIAIVIAFFVPHIERYREESNLIRCRDNLRKIGIVMAQYAHENFGALPVVSAMDGPDTDLLRPLAAAGCLGNPEIFFCPSQREPSHQYSPSNFQAGNIGYFYYGATGPGADSTLSKFLRDSSVWPRKLNTSMDPMTWVMSDIWASGIPTAHAGYKKGVNYLMLDGSVDFLSESPRKSFH